MVLENHMELIDTDLENLLAWAKTQFSEEELIQAKEDYFWKFGKVFHDDSFYESRMFYFIDYFLLERPLSRMAANTLRSPFTIKICAQTGQSQNEMPAALR